MDEKALVDVIAAELDTAEMVLADPLTLRRLKAERIARAVRQALSPGSTGSAEGWRDDLDGMPFGQDFLAENRFGDWLTVRRFDPKKPGDYSSNAVINGRTGRWWHPLRWRPLPDPPSAMLSAAGGRDEP